MQSMSTETAGFSHALCIGYSEETETGPKETVQSWDFLCGMQDYVATQGILTAQVPTSEQGQRGTSPCLFPQAMQAGFGEPELWRSHPSFIALSGPKASLRCTALSDEVMPELLSLPLLALSTPSPLSLVLFMHKTTWDEKTGQIPPDCAGC